MDAHTQDPKSDPDSHHKSFDLDAYRRDMAAMIGTAPQTQVFWSALEFAVKAHEGQFRKAGDPYIVHPCTVAHILAGELDIRSPDILAAALLHDTIEDVPGVTAEGIREQFGPSVEAIVEGCTKVTNFQGDRQTLRKLVHRKIFSGAAARLEVMLVKLADRLHNMRTLGFMPRHKRLKIAEETLDIYAPLATILGLYDFKRELYELALTYRFPKQSKRIKAHIRELDEAPAVRAVIDAVQAGLRESGVEAAVQLRTRGLWAYYDMHHHIMVHEIENPRTIVIVTADRDSCYTALGVLDRIYPPTPRSIRDFIANPKPTGYQGLHARANIGGSLYLFKIRTEEMSRRAQRGLLRDWERGSKASARFFEQIQDMFDVMGQDESMSYRDLIAASDRKEIYTYTPKGDLICLPAQSIVLDFAFRVHSDVGRTCVGAMIGRKRVPVDQRLKDGDMVRILRTEDNSPVEFGPELQARSQTALARSILSRSFRERREEVSRNVGKSILKQEMRRYGIPRELLDHAHMPAVLAYFGIPDMPTLHLALGEGRLGLAELINEIRDCLYTGHSTLVPPTGEFNRVNLATVDPVVIKVSACCRPSPLDKGVVGLLSERGLSLHLKDCRQLCKASPQREDMVDVRWTPDATRIVKPQHLIVMRAARSRLLAQLASAPDCMRLGELVCLGRSDGPESDWEIAFQVENLTELGRIIRYFRHSGLTFEFELEA